MSKRTIQTQDGFSHDVFSDGEYRGFINGFKAALRCYGIYNDGVQHIGCMRTPVRDVIADFEYANPPLPEPLQDEKGGV